MSRGTRESCDLSPMQEAMLVECLRSADGDPYFRQLSVQVRGDIDGGALERAWRRVVHRHSILRTAFRWKGEDTPQQEVHEDAAAFEQVDLRGLPGESRAARQQAIAGADQQRGFQLDTPPLIRVTLVRLEDREWQIIWTYHHTILDGWSRARLMREVQLFYDAERTGRDVSLPPARPFSSYVEWLRQQDHGESEEFWRDALGGYQGCPLTWRSSGNPCSLRADTVTARVDTETTAALLMSARRARLTLNTGICAAWALLLSRLSGESDVAFGVCVSGRPPELHDIETAIGPFMNVVPLRIDVSPVRSAADFLHDIQTRSLDLQQHAYLSLPSIQRGSGVPGGRPLIESLVNFQNLGGQQETPASDDMAATSAFFVERVPQPLALFVSQGDQLSLRLRWREDCFDGRFARDLLDAVVATSRRLLSRPDAELQDIATVPEAAARSTVSIGLAAEVDIPAAARRVWRSAPDRVAVEAGGRAVTFRTLFRKAMAEAARLAAQGVRRGDPVGVMCDDDMACAAAAVAVWMGEGICVPLDPAWTAETLLSVLADARPVAVWTTGSYAALLKRTGATVIVEGGVGPAVAPPSRRLPSASGDAVASIAYQVESDGPVGIRVTHGMLAEALRSARPPTQDEPVRLRRSNDFPLRLAHSVLQPLIEGCGVVVEDVTAEIHAHPWAGGAELAFTPAEAADTLVVQPRWQLAPVGATGWLWRSGPALSPGYAGRADLTADRMRPHPTTPGSRMFGTGHLARIADGRLLLVADAQRWTRTAGRAVNLHEVEQALRRFPGVVDACAAAIDGPSGAREVEATLRFADGPPPALPDVQAWMHRRLPAFAHPAVLHLVSAMDPDATAGSVDGTLPPDPEREALERELCTVWADVLGVARVERHDNFFLLGGHSLLANAVASRVADRLGCEVPIRMLFDAPTVARFAAAIHDSGLTATVAARAS